MYIVAIAWIFVVLLMGAAEAQAGSLLGGIMTFIFYGIFPLSIVLYLLATPQRWRNKKARESAERAALLSAEAKTAQASNTATLTFAHPPEPLSDPHIKTSD